MVNDPSPPRGARGACSASGPRPVSGPSPASAPGLHPRHRGSALAPGLHPGTGAVPPHPACGPGPAAASPPGRVPAARVPAARVPAARVPASGVRASTALARPLPSPPSLLAHPSGGRSAWLAHSCCSLRVTAPLMSNRLAAWRLGGLAARRSHHGGSAARRPGGHTPVAVLTRLLACRGRMGRLGGGAGARPLGLMILGVPGGTGLLRRAGASFAGMR